MSITNNDNASLSPPITIRDIQDGEGPTQSIGQGKARSNRFMHHADQNTSAMNVLANEENEQLQD